MKNHEEKQVGVKARQEYYNSLTIQQKIDKLDNMFGKGLGATRERTRLAKLLAEDTKSVKKGKK